MRLVLLEAPSSSYQHLHSPLVKLGGFITLHFGKYTYLLSGEELDGKFDTTHMYKWINIRVWTRPAQIGKCHVITFAVNRRNTNEDWLTDICLSSLSKLQCSTRTRNSWKKLFWLPPNMRKIDQPAPLTVINEHFLSCLVNQPKKRKKERKKERKKGRKEGFFSMAWSLC